MGPKPKPDPIKHCAHCGNLLHRKRFASGQLEDMGRFNIRRYCNRDCMAKGQLRETVTYLSCSWRKAHKTVKRACEICGRASRRLHVHHKDGNPFNNAPWNLQSLCTSCHRLSHSPRFMGTPLQPKPCIYCSKQVARKGLCNTHLTRLKRYGNPLVKKFKVGSTWVLCAEQWPTSRANGCE